MKVNEQDIKTGAMLKGRMVHEWMSEFARSPMRFAVVAIEDVLPKPKPVQRVQEPWVPYGDWSNEAGGRVGRMMALAEVAHG